MKTNQIRCLGLSPWVLAAAFLLYCGLGDVDCHAHSVSLGTTSYLYAPGRQAAFPFFQLVGEGEHQSKYFEAKARGELVMVFAKETPYLIELPELYAGTLAEDADTVESIHFKIGRKLHSWNHLDDEWQLGVWQPRFRWDYVRPESVGLTGAFLEYKQRYFQAVAFGSPFFVPERGIPIHSENGTLQSPLFMWFNAPSSQATILDQQERVTYSLHTPEIKDIVLQTSASFQARVGEEGAGPWLSAGYAYKPMNQVLMAYDGVLEAANHELAADLYPRIGHHHLLSLESGYEARGFSGWFSALLERPAEEVLPRDWTYQQMSSSVALSPGIRTEFKLWGDSPANMDLSYLWQQGGNSPDAGKRADGSDSKFEERYPFQRALNIGGEVPVPGTKKVRANGHVLYDIGHQGSIYSASFNYIPARDLSMNLGTDLFGTWTDRLGKDFISRYRANNRVYAGVTYGF